MKGTGGAGPHRLTRRRKEMADNLLGRLWTDNHESASRDAARRIELVRGRLAATSGDPIPLVARAMALVLAVSLTGLTVAATGA